MLTQKADSKREMINDLGLPLLMVDLKQFLLSLIVALCSLAGRTDSNFRGAYLASDGSDNLQLTPKYRGRRMDGLVN